MHILLKFTQTHHRTKVVLAADMSGQHFCSSEAITKHVVVPLSGKAQGGRHSRLFRILPAQQHPFCFSMATKLPARCYRPEEGGSSLLTQLIAPCHFPITFSPLILA